MDSGLFDWGTDGPPIWSWGRTASSQSRIVGMVLRRIALPTSKPIWPAFAVPDDVGDSLLGLPQSFPRRGLDQLMKAHPAAVLPILRSSAVTSSRAMPAPIIITAITTMPVSVTRWRKTIPMTADDAIEPR